MEHDETRGRPLVTYLLMSASALVQLYVSALTVPEAQMLFEKYALHPVMLLEGVGLEKLLTYMFLHGSWMHFLVNSIALWGAGLVVERDIGSARYFIVYLFSGVVAGLVHSFLHMSSNVPVVGASGAIFGVIALLFLLMPFKITFTLIVPLPSVIVGIMLSAVEFSAAWIATDGFVAHDAHLAGFIFGCICAFAIDRRRALKGLIIAATAFVILYYLGIHFGLV